VAVIGTPRQEPQGPYGELLEKRPGGAAGLRYTILYGKFPVKLIFRVS